MAVVLLSTFGARTNPGASFGPFGSSGAQSFDSLGERIFLSGTGATGSVIPRSTPSMYNMMFSQAGCALVMDETDALDFAKPFNKRVLGRDSDRKSGSTPISPTRLLRFSVAI